MHTCFCFALSHCTINPELYELHMFIIVVKVLHRELFAFELEYNDVLTLDVLLDICAFCGVVDIGYSEKSDSESMHQIRILHTSSIEVVQLCLYSSSFVNITFTRTLPNECIEWMQ